MEKYLRFYLVAVTALLFVLSENCFAISKGQINSSKIETMQKARGKNKKVKIQTLLGRINSTKAYFKGATRQLNQGRNILFKLAATQAKKEELAAKEKELAAAKSKKDKEKIAFDIQKWKTAEIKRARKSGELEKKKLNKKELTAASKLIFNISLAIIYDQIAADQAPQIITDGKAVMKRAKNDKIWAMKNAKKIKKVSKAVSKDIPEIVKEAPKQLETLKEFLAAANSLKKNNDIPDLGQPTKDDKPVPASELDF